MSSCHVACVDGFSAPIGCPRTHTWRHLGRLQVILAASRRTLRVGHCLYECRQAFLQRWYSCYTPLIYHPSALRLAPSRDGGASPRRPRGPRAAPEAAPAACGPWLRPTHLRARLRLPTVQINLTADRHLGSSSGGRHPRATAQTRVRRIMRPRRCLASHTQPFQRRAVSVVPASALALLRCDRLEPWWPSSWAWCLRRAPVPRTPSSRRCA